MPAASSTRELLCETIIAIRCPKRTRDGVFALAARRGKTTSEILRELIAAALGQDGTNRPPPPSVAAA